MEFNVVFFYALALLQRASGGTDAKAQIPKRPRKIGNQRPERLLGFVTAEEKKDIEIGVRKKEPPAIAAQRQQTKTVRRRVVNAQHFAEHVANVGVGKLAQRCHGFTCADTRLEL